MAPGAYPTIVRDRAKVVTDDALRMSATSAASLAVNAAVAFIGAERDALTTSGRERARAVQAEVKQAA